MLFLRLDRQNSLWARHARLEDCVTISKQKYSGDEELACVANVSWSLGTKNYPRKMGREKVVWLSPHFSRGQNIENPVLRSFVAPKPHGDACYVG